MLKDVLIYNFSDGFENAHIIWAAEGKLELTADKKHLYLHLYNGEQFENLKSQSALSKTSLTGVKRLEKTHINRV